MTCTCAGTAPGYPQHEDWCGKPESHAVQVESDTVQLYRWECATCGAAEDGYTDLAAAEFDADEHWASR